MSSRVQSRIFVALALAATMLVTPVSPGQALTIDDPVVEWDLMFGTEQEDTVEGVVIDDDGYRYVAGSTRGDLGDRVDGDFDGYIRKYSPTGVEQWTVHVATDGADNVFTIDEWDGTLVVGGRTTGELVGSHHGGTWDAFIAAYDADDGAFLWADQFGTATRDSVADLAIGIGTIPWDIGGPYVYATGTTSADIDHDPVHGSIYHGGTDAFMRQWPLEHPDYADGDADGRDATYMWGSAQDEVAYAVAVDDRGFAYAAGTTLGDLYEDNEGISDMYLLWFDAGMAGGFGEKQWGTSSLDRIDTMEADGTTLYIGGTAGNDFGPGGVAQTDAMLMTIDTSRGGRAPSLSDPQIALFGSPRSDSIRGISIDPDGTLVVSGTTTGSLVPDAVNEHGVSEIFVANIDPDAGPVMAWSEQIPSPDAIGSLKTHIAMATDGTFTLAASTLEALDGPNIGSSDVYLRNYAARLNPTPVAPTIAGHHQFGSSGDTEIRHLAAAADGTTVFTTGFVAGAEGDEVLLQPPNPENRSNHGAWNASWIGADTVGTSVADAGDGDAIAVGQTLDHHPPGAPLDAGSAGWIARFDDSERDVAWLRYVIPDNEDHVSLDDVVVHDGVAYTVGTARGDVDLADPEDNYRDSRRYPTDVFVQAYAVDDGTLLWTEQYANSLAERSGTIAVDGDGTLVIAFERRGRSTANIATWRINPADGSVIWTQETTSDRIGDVSGMAFTDEGDIAVVGVCSCVATGAVFGSEAFVQLVGSDGTLRWTRRLGVAETDQANGVAIADDGTIVVVGTTAGAFAGEYLGGTDMFAVGYDRRGTPRWMRQWGTAEDDGAESVTGSPRGTLWVGGWTDGALSSDRAGRDAVITGLVYTPTVTPELTVTAGAGGLEFRWGPSDSNYVRYTVSLNTGETCIGFGACRIEGLANGSYTATIRSENPAGATLFGSATTVDPLITCGDDMNHPFTDVRSSSFADDDIGCIFAIEVTQGTSPTTYGPADHVTREQMGAFLARLWRSISGDPCTGIAHPFTDLAGSFADDAVGCIYDLGITTGTSATTYGPKDFVTREQMAAFLARFIRLDSPQACIGEIEHPFTDTSPTSFARNDFGCIYDLGITTGTSATTYGPSELVTREQMGAFLGRVYRLLSPLGQIGD